MALTKTQLSEIGYTESERRGIFYKKCLSGTAFVHLSWHEQHKTLSLFNLTLDFQCQSVRHPPPKQERDIALLQVKLLGINENECSDRMRKWLYGGACPRCNEHQPPTACRVQQELVKTMNRIKRLEQWPQCAVCGYRIVGWGNSSAHYIHYPEIKINVHPDCHRIIHHTDGFLPLNGGPCYCRPVYPPPPYSDSDSDSDDYRECPTCGEFPTDKDCWIDCHKKKIRIAIAEFEKLPKCAVCNLRFGNDEKPIIHHTAYFPESTVPVHHICHMTIHHTGEFLHLRPPDGDGAKFYSQSYRDEKKATREKNIAQQDAEAKALRIAKAKREQDIYEATHRPSARHNIVPHIPVDEKARDAQLAKEKAIIDRMRSKFA